MKSPCVLKNALLTIRDDFGMSFATKSIGLPCSTFVTITVTCSLQIILLSNYSLLIISVLAENTLLKTTYHFLLLLVGFDTLTYWKDYDRSPILVGHHYPYFVTGWGHRNIEPKTKHLFHCKKCQSSWPDQTDNLKRLAKISNHAYKNSEKNQIIFTDNLDHKSTIHQILANTPQKSITSNRSPRTSRRTLYWESKREKKPSSY